MTILVCRCGKRLRAPGATPGRVGHCPACGAALRVPEPAAGPADESMPVESAPAPAPVTRSSLHPERAVPTPAQPADPPPERDGRETTLSTSRGRPRGRKRRSRATLADKLDTLRGFVPQPEGP
ncbi:MAG TPA: hypothetical protein VFF52_24305, partial [Isosphaeraceae bacterium]|nr:hypothetical protein [Isosphaeraceae bacterium]